MHFIPESDRTDKDLFSLLDLYALVLNHDSHVLREAWLRLFTAFKQPDVCVSKQISFTISLSLSLLLLLLLLPSHC